MKVASLQELRHRHRRCDRAGQGSRGRRPACARLQVSRRFDGKVMLFLLHLCFEFRIEWKFLLIELLIPSPEVPIGVFKSA